MKRFALTASALLAFSMPAVAQARVPTRQHASEYAKAYRAVARQFGRRTPGRNIMRDGFDNHRGATDADVVASLAVLQRMLAPPPPPVAQASAPVGTQTTSTPTGSTSGGLADVPGVPASFAACVAMRESTNGQGSSNIYGILGGGGSGSIDQQKQAFSQMYAQHGTQPWAPYDGC